MIWERDPENAHFIYILCIEYQKYVTSAVWNANGFES